MHKFRSLFTSLFLAAALLFVAGCDDDPTEVLDTDLAPPQGPVVVNLDQVSGSYAVISWSASPDETLEEFVGYMVKTYDVTGTTPTLVDSTVVAKSSHTYSSTTAGGFDIVTGKKYKTYVYSYNEDKEFSSSIESNVFGGVIVKTSQTIDQFSTSSTTSSAYGWSTAGQGQQYSYDSDFDDNIDIHCRVDNGGNLTLYSPASAPTPKLQNPRTTAFLTLTADDWTKSRFDTEPTKTSVTVSQGDVILIKNADGYYVKIKVQAIATQGSGTSAYNKVTFDYKFQNVQGLRAAKR